MIAQLGNGKFITRAGTPTVDTGATGVIDAANDVMVVDVQDLVNISLFVNQLVDAGTVTLVIEKTIDGVNWTSANANLSEASFAAGNNQAKEITLSDASGMALAAKQLRVTASALAGGGSYSILAAGTQRLGYR